MTGRDLDVLARAGARITVWVTAEDGREVADITARIVGVVGIDGPVVVACTPDGRELRLPVDTAGAAALVVSAAGGRL